MLEIHDSYTENHSRNVAELSKKIAKEMSLCQEKIDHAHWTGIVHDIGKILIPVDILNKKGKLTELEYDIITPKSSR